MAVAGGLGRRRMERWKWDQGAAWRLGAVLACRLRGLVVTGGEAMHARVPGLLGSCHAAVAAR